MTASTGTIMINTIAEARETHTSIVIKGCLMVEERVTVKGEKMMMAEIVEMAEEVEITAVPGTFAVVVTVILSAMDEEVDEMVVADADNR